MYDNVERKCTLSCRETSIKNAQKNINLSQKRGHFYLWKPPLKVYIFVINSQKIRQFYHNNLSSGALRWTTINCNIGFEVIEGTNQPLNLHTLPFIELLLKILLGGLH